MRSIKAKERPGWDQITLRTISCDDCETKRIRNDDYMKLRFRYEQ